MTPETLVEAVRREGLVLADTARLGIDAEVPSCTGWTVSDVVIHVGRVYRSVAAIVASRSQVIIPRGNTPHPPTDGDIVDWMLEGHAEVVASLSDIDPAEKVWTWSGVVPSMFYFRRMAHETAIHRWDVEDAFGQPAGVDGDLGADGVDEFYRVVLPFSASRWERELPTGSLHLHRIDGDGEWMLTASAGQIDVRLEHARGDAAVRATGSDLFLLAWNRIGPHDVDVFGDTEVIGAWAELAP